MGQVHPFHVLRLSEIKAWTTGGEYQKILNGEYPRRGTDERPGVSEEFKKSGKSYAQAYAESQDPLIRFLRDKIGLFRKGSKDRFD
jgi:hypothetical protein